MPLVLTDGLIPFVPERWDFESEDSKKWFSSPGEDEQCFSAPPDWDAQISEHAKVNIDFNLLSKVRAMD